LQAWLVKEDKDLAAEKTKLQGEINQSQALEDQLAGTSNQFLLTVTARNIDYSNASAPVKALQAQINNIDNEIAAIESPGGAINDPPCGNHFAFGQCTWYVATRRCVPWLGNADQWFGAAAAYGYQEGHSPEVGAIVVFWPGGDGASWVGHVGYVEAVGPADGIPAGYFRMSEMNYAGWDVVSYRILPDGSSGIQGFIYGR
jgi:surface antigen